MNKLPKQYKDIAEFDKLNDILNLSDNELYLLLDNIQREQFILLSKNVGLDIWSRTLLTTTDKRDILTKLRGLKTITKTNLALIIRDILKQDVPVEITERNHEYIVLLGIFDVGDSDLKSLKKMLLGKLKMIIPSHISLDLYFNEMIWLKFDEYDKTFNEWDNLDLTWIELEKYNEGII